MSNEKLTNEQIELIQQQVLEIMEDLDPTKGRLIQLKQGPRTALAVDSLMIGEPCYLTDDKIFVIGTGNGYIEFPNIESLSDLGVSEGSITYENLNQALKDRILELEESKVTVIDSLTSDSIEEALSAKQGKELNAKIQSIIDNEKVVVINDTLTSDSEEEALSAKQGKVLDLKIKDLMDNAVTVNVIDALDSTSTSDPLSANQGKVLNDKVKDLEDSKITINNTLTSDSVVEALSAKQGKELNAKIDKVISESEITIIIDNLTSNSDTEALSANQGRILNETKASKDIANTTTDGLLSKEDKVKLNSIAHGATNTPVINTLTSTSVTSALSANQGKILNDTKANKTKVTTSEDGLMSKEDKSKLDTIAQGATKVIVTDNVTSTSSLDALSANQGKILNDRIDEVIANNDITIVTDNLTSTSVEEALSANQGRILNETKAPKDKVSDTTDGLMSKEDKVKLDSISTEANKVIVVDALNSTSDSEALSANQGRLLNENKADRTLVTTSVNGLMSSSDKVKLNGIADGANKTIVADNLNSESTTEVLSAKQGKVLNDTKASKDVATIINDGLMSSADKIKLDSVENGATKTTIVDNLTTNTSNEALSAKQGKVLNDRIDEVIANNDITIVTDNLTSNSSTEALSANQGRILNETKASKDKASTSVDGLMSKEDKVKLNGVEIGATKTIINDTLNSTSNTEALSASQGKLLNDTKASKDVVTTSVNGLMSSVDKVKLNGIADGANKTTVVNSLTSTSTSDALSANQGKLLNDTKADKTVASITSNGLMSSIDKVKLNGVEDGANKTTIIDNVTSTSTTSGLSANQGKILNDRIDEVIANNDITIVTDNLNSTSSTEALSANQGKILNDTKASKDIVTLTANGLMSAVDKVKLNGIDEGANKTVYINNLSSTSTTEALTANQGRVLDGKITTLSNNKADKINATNTTDGLMSKEDKVKLNGIENEANKTIIVDDLTSTSAIQALSANQGRILNDRIDEVVANNDITIVTDNLSSDSATEALSAKQGKLLNEKIQNHIDNDVVLNVVDNLNSTSSADVLSANQGRLLNNNKADKTLASTTVNGLMSSSDKVKLNGIESGANKTIISDNLTSITSTTALSANQGRVLNEKIQDLIDNPVGTTINDTLTSTSTSEALSANQGKVLNDNQNAHANKKASKTELGHVNAWEQGINIPTSAWQGASAPYTASISLADIKSTDNPLITPIYNIDYAIALNQRDNYAKIDEATTSNGTINFRCFEEKPDIQLSLLVKVVSS